MVQGQALPPSPLPRERGTKGMRVGAGERGGAHTLPARYNGMIYAPLREDALATTPVRLTSLAHCAG